MCTALGDILWVDFPFNSSFFLLVFLTQLVLLYGRSKGIQQTLFTSVQRLRDRTTCQVLWFCLVMRYLLEQQQSRSSLTITNASYRLLGKSTWQLPSLNANVLILCRNHSTETLRATSGNPKVYPELKELQYSWKMIPKVVNQLCKLFTKSGMCTHLSTRCKMRKHLSAK